ncbi:hypothetical protein BZZ01_05045 [Nostocales cyanobacterium HT-58-2]|nr:hypothetical protein BZZ01_05045 [Nostocales cyanobacterium HT-58-2]
MKTSNFPCWLSPIQLEEAEALINLGFRYCGNADNFCVERKVSSVGKWTFYTCDGQVALDAICDGALYSRCLELETWHGDQTWFNNQVRQARKAIQEVQRRKKERQGVQLSLFEVQP